MKSTIKWILSFFLNNCDSMEENTCNVPHLRIIIDENEINSGAKKVLEVIRPSWNIDRVNFKLLTDGITNKLVACLPQDLPEDETVLVRIYGNKTDLLIDRKAENRNIEMLNRRNLAPNLYATFENGLAYKFVPGCPLDDKMVLDRNIYPLVARRLAKLHKVKINGLEYPKPCLWNKIREFLDIVPEEFSNDENRKRFMELNVPSKVKIKKEIDELQQVLEPLNTPVVFCHNDLLLGNVILIKSKDDVSFIDYEYAGFNYQAFDIANHFAECVGIDIETLDYSKFPSRQLQLDWLSIYLSEFKDRNPTTEELENLYVQVDKFLPTSHLFWSIWALIQAEHSYIDFDFMRYVTSMIEYRVGKHILLWQTSNSIKKVDCKASSFLQKVLPINPSWIHLTLTSPPWLKLGI